MMAQFSARHLSAGFIAFAALLLAGCSQPTAEVSGTVTVNDVPLPAGEIVFICAGGTKPVHTATIQNGQYRVANVPLGNVQITIAGATPPKIHAVPNMPKGMKIGDSPDGNSSGSEKGNPRVIVAERYGDPARSGQTLDVKSGGSITHNINLKP